MWHLSDQLAQIADLVRRLEDNPLQHHIFEVIEACHDEVICFDDEDDDMDLAPSIELVVKVKEVLSLKPEDFLVIKLDVEKPRPF